MLTPSWRTTPTLTLASYVASFLTGTVPRCSTHSSSPVAGGKDVHVTQEPSDGPIGKLCRELTETTTGRALACLYTADRYHHVETEIRPNMRAGRIVLSDRYIPSGLVMQRFDAVEPVF